MIERLKKRAEFLQAARGKRAVMPGLVLQLRERNADISDHTAGEGMRVGFTVTRKVGNAVIRNRAKRRLRAAAETILPSYGLPGCDYVVIGRAATPTRPFSLLLKDLERALAKVHGRGNTKRRSRPSPVQS